MAKIVFGRTSQLNDQAVVSLLRLAVKAAQQVWNADSDVISIDLEGTEGNYQATLTFKDLPKGTPGGGRKAVEISEDNMEEDWKKLV